MRRLCVILIFFTGISLSFAESEVKQTRKLIKLIYKEGYLINQGEQDLLRAEITAPFYRYLGDIPQGAKVNVSDIKTKFTVQYTAKQWIGEYEIMKETFIPEIKQKAHPASLNVQTKLKGNTLSVKVSSQDKISDIFIEILSDIPIKISEDRTRFVLSSVGVRGQNLKRGPEADFKLYLLVDQKFYKVPVQITYVFGSCAYDKFFIFSFKKEEFKDAP